MGETHPVIEDETEQLRRISTLLQENPYETPPSEKSIVAELVRLREEMPRSKEEDKGSLMQQYDQQFALLKTLRASRDKPLVDPDSPYFAHVRLREEGRSRDVFLGKATRLDHGMRIVDWRNAPVSKIFYRYRQGEHYEEAIGHRTLEGVVTARRTLTIERGSLVRIDAPEGVFSHDGDDWKQTHHEPPRLAGGQAATLQAHAVDQGQDRRLGTDLTGNRRRQDKRLPDIAGLIDAEQFELITKPRSGFVVIRGTAGSGKTTVALHRIAWLAYEDPGYNSPNTVFMVFSRALKDYVSHVLPALGAPRARVESFPEWAASQRKRHFPKLPNKERDTAPAIVTRLKQHPAMLLVLKEQVHRVGGRAIGEQAIDDWMSAISGLDLLQEVFKEHAPNAFTHDEFLKIVDYTRDRNTEVMRWLEGEREDLDAATEPEDAPLLLRAWQLRCGPLRGKHKAPLRYKHLAIDEVQDFSPTEVRVLLECLDKQQSITLAGDTQQHVMQDSGFTSWFDFFKHLGVEGTAVNTLKISYRSSAEIVEFAMKLLGDLLEDDELPTVTRSGPPVEMFRFTDHGATVAFLADALKELMQAEPLASVILLTPDSRVSSTYYAGLRSGEVPRLRRVQNQNFQFEPGVEITELDQVKGLEFDYVILVEPNSTYFPDSPGARRLLHVGATRAVHQLWVTSVGTPSAIIRAAL